MRLVRSQGLFLGLLLALCGAGKLAANPPANLFYDTAILFDVRGVNPWPDNTEDAGVTFDLLPFYQHAKGAKNCRGQKVPKGDRTGRMNMIGLLQGRGVAPDGAFDEGTPLGNALSILNEAGYGPQKVSDPKFDVTDSCFTGSNLLGRYSVGINYEGFGVRGQLRGNFGGGFGITARSGAVCYKQVPCFLDLTLSCSTTADFDCNLTNTFGPECDDTRIGKDQHAGFSTEIQQLIRDTLTNPQARCEIAEQLGIDLKKVSRAAFEDTHLDLHWGGSFAFEDEDDHHIVSVIPYVAAGVWLPSGESKNEDILFRLPTGNDGFWGYTLEGILNFDFPEALTLGFGGAVTFFPGSRNRCRRMPSRTRQVGLPPSGSQQELLFPWKAQVKQEMGTTWHVHGDLMTKDFLDDRLSFYASYIYSKHQQDSYKFINPDCEDSFDATKLERESQWESQLVHFALDYRVTKNLYFGFGFTGMLTGRRVYRPSVLIGTIRLYFG